MGFLAVCGPDGSGKSTLVTELAAELGIDSLPERPMELSAFSDWIANPTRSRLVRAQRAFMKHALDRQASAALTGGVVERLIWDNLSVFLRGRLELGDLLEDDYNDLVAEFSPLAAAAPRPAAIIYLDSRLDVLITSMAARGRVDDEAMDRRSATCFHALYADWISTVDYCDVLRIEALSCDARSLASKVSNQLRALDIPTA